MADTTCSVDGCERKTKSRGLCNAHYQKWRTYGDPLADRTRKGGICSIDGCERKRSARGWCDTHYSRWRHYGDPLIEMSCRGGICSVDGCDSDVIARGYCTKHYQRFMRRGNPKVAAYIFTDDLSERLRHYIPASDPDDCWEWTGGMTRRGYGHIVVGNSRSRRAHVVAWEQHNGRKVPEGMLIRHTCDNPPCCNPAHLLLGTCADNMRDKVERGRQARGETNGRHKLTESDVLEIRKLYAEGALQVVLADRYGVSGAHISSIVRRESWKHVA